MKKVVLVLALAVFIAGGAFAQLSFSAGVGGSFGAYFTNYLWTSDAKDWFKLLDLDEDIYDSSTIGGSVYAFFDATFVEINIGMFFGNTKSVNEDQKKDDKGFDLTQLSIGLLGKFPISVSSGITIFPMIGIDLLLTLDAQYDGEKIENDKDKGILYADYFDQFFIKFGIGADIALAGSLYLRPSFLYGIRFNTEGEKDRIDNFNTGTKMVDGIVGHGLQFRLALGFKF